MFSRNSLGVILAGIAIIFTEWQWLAPIISLIISFVVVLGTWQLLKGSLDLASNAVPEGIEPLAVRTYLAKCSGGSQVHDLHIWGISTTETALTAYLVMLEGHPGDEFLAKVCQELHQHFGIGHSTLQIEMGNTTHFCPLAPDHIV